MRRLEPEVLDLIAVVRKMGAKIAVDAPATIIIEGVTSLQPIEHAIIPDRLEAGALLIGRSDYRWHLQYRKRMPIRWMFLVKLEEMGHEIIVALKE